MEKATHQDSTEFEGPVPTGDAQAKRAADKKKNGQQEPDTTVSNIDKGTVFKSGKVAEEISALFKDVNGLTEDFTDKAVTIFEGAVSGKIEELREELEAEYSARLDEATDQIAETFEDKLDEYLNLVVEEFINENRVAIEEGIRGEIAEQVINSMVSIVESAGVELPEDKIDVAEALATANEELEAKLNEAVEKNISLEKEVRNFQINELFSENTEDLSASAKEKLKKLTENISYDSAEQYVEKLGILKESVVDGKTLTNTNTDIKDLNESTDAFADKNAALTDWQRSIKESVSRF